MHFLKITALWIEQFARTVFVLIVESLFLLLRCPAMFPIHLRLWETSLQTSPYLLSRQAQSRSDSSRTEEWTYGEVSLPSIWRGLSMIDWSDRDRLIDLGSGRGRVVFLGASLGIRSHGIEWFQPLVNRGQQIAHELQPLASFERNDMLTADWSEGTVFWLTGTCLHHETLQKIVAKLEGQQRAITVLSVTRPLSSPHLQTLHEVPIGTTWGKDRLFLQRLVPPANLDKVSATR